MARTRIELTAAPCRRVALHPRVTKCPRKCSTHRSGDKSWIRNRLCTFPRPTDFVAPYIFFATRDIDELTFVSPSVSNVLGYDSKAVLGQSYTDFLIQDDPLNDDLRECQRASLPDGASIHALRSVRDIDGKRHVLSVHTVGVSEFEGKPATCRHNIARDVTESVESHGHMMMRLKELESATRGLLIKSARSPTRFSKGR